MSADTHTTFVMIVKTEQEDHGCRHGLCIFYWKSLDMLFVQGQTHDYGKEKDAL